MDILSSSLREKISSRPINTILRSDNKELDQEFIDIAFDTEKRRVQVPDIFDGRVVWDGLLNKPMDQGKCGSCWAFSTTGTLADRFNIQSLGIMNIQLSPAKLVLCSWQYKEFSRSQSNILDNDNEFSEFNLKNLENKACYGNSLLEACHFLFDIGTTTEDCVPYNKNLGNFYKFEKIGEFKNIAQLPLCSAISGITGDMCSDFYLNAKTGVERGTPSRFYKAFYFYTIRGVPKDGGSQYNIKNNIYKWGPLSTAMQVYPDFYTFDSKREIYEWDGNGPQLGGHACEIVGWGKEGNKEYWIIKNSWGTDWGDKGYFRMIRGINNCQIEENCIGLVPDFFFPINYKAIGNEILYGKQNIGKERKKIATYIEVLAGGIDTTTGYSRRAMSAMPWLNLSPPIELDDLPDWNKFIAGRDASIKNRVIYQSIVRQKNSDIRYSKQSLQIYVTVSVILIIAILFILFLMWKNNRK
jgi:hypothetical protein